MRLIKAAPHHTGILQRTAVWSCVAGRRRLWCRRDRCWHDGCWGDGGWGDGYWAARGLRHAVWRRGLLLGVWRRLTVSDEFCIAGGAGPRRRIGRYSAGPMRPMIGDKAAAARKTKSNSEQSYRCNEPLGGHKAAGYLVREYISICRHG